MGDVCLLLPVLFQGNKETLLNISNGESANIAFPLPLPKEETSWPQPGDNTGLGFMMQVNRTAAVDSHGTTTTIICVYRRTRLWSFGTPALPEMTSPPQSLQLHRQPSKLLTDDHGELQRWHTPSQQ